MPGFNVDDVLYRCLSKLAWLEEAWYYWVIVDELTWNRYYDKAAGYVRRSLQWLKSIILNNKADGGLREDVERLIREIEPIDGIDALSEGRVLGLTTKFRHVFYHHLAECIVEEATAVGSLIQPAEQPVGQVEQ